MASDVRPHTMFYGVRQAPELAHHREMKAVRSAGESFKGARISAIPSIRRQPIVSRAILQPGRDQGAERTCRSGAGPL